MPYVVSFDHMIVSEFAARSKLVLQKIPRDVLIVAILFFSSSASFGLGFLAGRDIGQGSGFSIAEIPLTASPQGCPSAATVPAAIPAGGQVVASKSGSKYHLPWCSGAQAIKEENKVWFGGCEASGAAGFGAAGNFQGL